MERQPCHDVEHVDADEGVEHHRSLGHGQVYAPSEYPESVASFSVEGNVRDERSGAGAGQVYASSRYAESVASRSEQGESPLEAADRSEDACDVRTGSAMINAPSECAESVASRSEQGESLLESVEQSEDTSHVNRTGSAVIYAPSKYAESVASKSEQGENHHDGVSQYEETHDARTGSAVIYAPSKYAESVATSSKQRGIPLEDAERIEDAFDVRTGSAVIYAPSKCAESVASSSIQRKTLVSGGAQIAADTDASSVQGEIYVPRQCAQSVTNSRIVTVSSMAELQEHLAVSGLQWPRPGAGDSDIASQPSGNSRMQISKPAQSESLMLQKAEDDATVTLPATLQEGNFMYELVDTIPTEARAINIRFDRLYTLSSSLLLTEYNPGSPRSPERHIQFKLDHPTHFSNIRFTFQLWLKTTVVVADGRLFLLDHNGHEIWSDQTGVYVHDISADFYIEGRVHVLTSTDIRIYHLEEDTLEFMDTVVPLPGAADSGKTYMFGDSLYITREKAGLVVKMDTNACQITDVFRDLVQPITGMTIGWIENAPKLPIVALADERNVHVYSKDAFDFLFTIPIGFDIIDIELISCRLFVLTDNGIKIYKVARR